MELCFSQKYRICLFMLYPNETFLQYTKKSINFDFWSSTASEDTKLLLSNQGNTKIRSSIGGLMIVMRKILIQNLTAWLQVLFGNKLLHPVSVSNFPGPKHGVFYILIVDLILRGAMLLSSMVCASNYHCNQGHVWFIFPLYSKYSYGELSILFLFILLGDATE